jgi:hypothetical protein
LGKIINKRDIKMRGEYSEKNITDVEHIGCIAMKTKADEDIFLCMVETPQQNYTIQTEYIEMGKDKFISFFTEVEVPMLNFDYNRTKCKVSGNDIEQMTEPSGDIFIKGWNMKLDCDLNRSYKD